MDQQKSRIIFAAVLIFLIAGGSFQLLVEPSVIWHAPAFGFLIASSIIILKAILNMNKKK